MDRQRKSYVGHNFGRVTVASESFGRPHRVRGACACGKTKVFRLYDLKRGATRSCGCLHRELMSSHGFGNSPEYHVWWNMIRRCYNKKQAHFEHYGGRGITVCERWKESVANFLFDMGPRPHGATLDRIDNNGNYEPGNCRWATDDEQRNNKGTSRFLTVRGRTLTISQWSRECGVNRHTIAGRLKRGWSVERASGLCL